MSHDRWGVQYAHAEVGFETEVQRNGILDHSHENAKLSRQDSFTVIPLNPDASISAGEFEKKWTDLPTV